MIFMTAQVDVSLIEIKVFGYPGIETGRRGSFSIVLALFVYFVYTIDK